MNEHLIGDKTTKRMKTVDQRYASTRRMPVSKSNKRIKVKNMAKIIIALMATTFN